MIARLWLSRVGDMASLDFESRNVSRYIAPWQTVSFMTHMCGEGVGFEMKPDITPGCYTIYWFLEQPSKYNVRNESSTRGFLDLSGGSTDRTMDIGSHECTEATKSDLP
jgi:hypothetical protein